MWGRGRGGQKGPFRIAKDGNGSSHQHVGNGGGVGFGVTNPFLHSKVLPRSSMLKEKH